MSLPILFLIAVTSAAPARIVITDGVHSRLSGIIQSTVTEELRSRAVDVRKPDEPADYIVEIVNVSDAGGKGRTSQIATDMTHSVEVTEIVGGAAAEIRLVEAGTRAVIASYKLSGSGAGSAAVGGWEGNVVTAFIVGPLFHRSRSPEAARAIAHDVAVRIASDIQK